MTKKYELSEDIQEMTNLDYTAEFALQQFIGFRHASMGLSIESLAQEMGLTADEWEVIRDDCIFTESDLEALDGIFGD